MNIKKRNSTWTLRIALLLVIAACASLLVPRQSRAAAADTPTFRKGEVIVEIKPTANIDDINTRIGTTTIQHIVGTYFYRLATPKRKKEAKFKKKLAKDPDVVSAALNPVVASPISVFGRSTVGFPDGHPSTGQSRTQYESQAIFGDISGIHTRSLGTDIIVAVIDTGVDLTHPDLASHLWTNPDEVAGDGIDNDGNGLVDDTRGWNFVNSTNDPSEVPGDPDTTVAGHGTFIAGLISLLAPGVKIMPIRAFDADGVSDAFSVSQAIKYAADNHARVINLSFGSPDDSALMHDAINYAADRGSILVAAAGNESENTDVSPQFPANWNQQVIGVAAVDSTDLKADFSNFGSTISVTAPGVRLISAFPQFSGASPYAQWSGTSFAAPLAVAEAALILERNPHLSARSLIEASSHNIDDRNPGFRGLLGHGRVDPLEALRGFDAPPSAHAQIDLFPTSIEPAAEGRAEIEITDSGQTFEVNANYLRPRDHYSLLVNGATIADDTVTSDAVCSDFGGIKFEFSTTPDGSHLPIPPGLNPVTLVQHVELRDHQGRVVLQGDFRPATGGSGGGPTGQSYEKETKLFPTQIAPQAKGHAKVEVDSQRESLEIEGEGLISGTTYRLIADGVDLGSANAQSGYLRVDFTSDGSSGHLLPPQLSPVSRISSIEIRDSSSRLVLAGTLQAGGGDVGGGDGGSETTFAGAIESLPASGLIGDWQVSGKIVHVSSSTEIRQEKGAPVIGAQVEVRGSTQQDGSVNATRVEVLSVQGGGGGGESRFTGLIQGLPVSGLLGDWQVAGHIVHVSSSTELKKDKGNFVIGAEVEVRGSTRQDGSVDASRIEVTKAAGDGGGGGHDDLVGYRTNRPHLPDHGERPAVVPASLLGWRDIKGIEIRTQLWV